MLTALTDVAKTTRASWLFIICTIGSFLEETCDRRLNSCHGVEPRAS
jgi:hypothetical protein